MLYVVLTLYHHFTLFVPLQFVYQYEYNTQNVKQSNHSIWIHRNVSMSNRYDACNWQDDIALKGVSMVDFYKEIVPKLERTWVYNGDTDP